MPGGGNELRSAADAPPAPSQSMSDALID